MPVVWELLCLRLAGGSADPAVPCCLHKPFWELSGGGVVKSIALYLDEKKIEENWINKLLIITFSCFSIWAPLRWYIEIIN